MFLFGLICGVDFSVITAVVVTLICQQIHKRKLIKAFGGMEGRINRK